MLISEFPISYFYNCSFLQILSQFKFPKSLRFPKNRGKKWNVVFLIQNGITIKYDRF